MAQCKKILYNGERCSNRAMPGTDYCEQHRGLKFRRESRGLSVSRLLPEKTEQEEKGPGKSAPFPKWVARPGATGATPAFPGLRSDGRNILVAPQGIIWLDEQSGQDQPESLFDKLVRLLACLSQKMRLPGNITVWMMPEEAGLIIRLTPPHPDSTDLSQYYDTIAAAVGLSGGLLYIGQERTFIRYRNSSAPQGYDAKDVQAPADDKLYLVDSEGTHSISRQTLTEESLNDLLLRIAPLPVRGADLPEVAFALVASPLYRTLARYFRDHYLHYRAARFQASTGDALILFEIAPRPDAPAGARVPAFVFSYLNDLPRCTVFTEVETDPTGHQMLVEWRHRYPCLPRHILDVFPTDSLLLFTTGLDFPNLCISPAPPFFNGDELISVHTPHPGQVGMVPITDRKNLPLELPLRLMHDPGPTPPTAALILDAEEIKWTCRLLYWLPGDAFGIYTLCLGQERAVLLGEGMSVESLPFGVPMRCVQDTQLFIPLRSRLVPDLPWVLLAEALELKDTMYSFLTPEFRLDLPHSAFAPLSRTLVAKPGRPRVTFDVHSTPDLAKLNWSLPSKLAEQPDRQPISTQKTSEPEQKGDMCRSSQRTMESPKATPTKEDYPVRREDLQNVEGLLLERAEFYRQAGDYLSAALCFAMSGDSGNAARCYQEAAYRIRASEK